jgi:hypothetical protein
VLGNYSSSWFHALPLTAFVESTVNLVVSRRFAKKQQMQWSKPGAHLLLQTRTRTLCGTLRDLFTGWYPAPWCSGSQNALALHFILNQAFESEDDNASQQSRSSICGCHKRQK